MSIQHVPRLASVSAVALTLALVLCGATCNGTQSPPLDFELDHFLVYRVENVPVNQPVRLADQFNPHLEDAFVEALTHFANPTLKVHDHTQVPIRHHNHHLSWYRLQRPEEPRPRIRVRFRNQFGTHEIIIRNARHLLVPSAKLTGADPSFPTDLDHYRCFEVVETLTRQHLPVVHLGDQWGSVPPVQVGGPVGFCAPCRKVREGEVTEVQNSRDHLTIYRLPRQEHVEHPEVINQFGGPQPLLVKRRVLLAVPTEKLKVGRLDQ